MLVRNGFGTQIITVVDFETALLAIEVFCGIVIFFLNSIF